MKLKKVKIKVSTQIGSISGEYTLPGKSICILTLAHGAGAGMHHPFMKQLSEALAERSIATLRFNFPFTEQNKRRPDVPAVAHQAIDAVIAHARKQTKLPLFLSGKSFGGRMSSQYLSAHHDTNASGIIFFGFPLHPPGKPSIERAEHLKTVNEPMLFLSGTRDEFATLKLLKKVCKSLPAATLITIKDANHGFKAGKLNTIELLADYTKDWVEEMT